MPELPKYDKETLSVKHKTSQNPPVSPNPIFVPPHPLRGPKMDKIAQQEAIKRVWPDVYFDEVNNGKD